MGIKKNAQSPMVGLFWQVQGRLVTRMVTLEKAEVFDERYDIADDHFSFWEQWTATHRPDLVGLSYDHFPRGRVIFDAAVGEFKIYADRCLLASRRFGVMIRHAFGLTGRKSVFKDDTHYQCHRCNKMFIAD